MKEFVLGIVLVVAGGIGLAIFQEPVGTYTVDLVGRGDEAGQLVEAECRDGLARGRFAGDERADSECDLAQDGVEFVRLAKLGAAAAVVAVGLFALLSGGRRWLGEVRSGRSYRKMMSQYDRTSSDG